MALQQTEINSNEYHIRLAINNVKDDLEVFNQKERQQIVSKALTEMAVEEAKKC